MNAEEIKKRLGELSQAEGDDGVLPAVLLRLVESNEKIVERIDVLEAAQKRAGESFAAKLEAVERALSAQAKKDLAGLQAAQKEAGELSAAKLETIESALIAQARESLNRVIEILADLKTLQNKTDESFSSELNLTRKDLADLQTAQKEARESTAANLKTVEHALSVQEKRSRDGVKIVFAAVVVAAITVISFIWLND